MNPDDLLEKLKAIEILRNYPKLKPILDELVEELEAYAKEIANEGKDEVQTQGVEEARPKAIPSGQVKRV